MAFATTPGQVYESVKDSVVVVKVYDRQGKQSGFGSGVMLPSGDIITNYHVAKGGVRYTVGRGKQAAPATLKAGDSDKDLCLLAAGLVGEPARLGKTARLKVGDPVYAVGAPQGLELSLSEGIISQLRGGGPHPIIQTTVAISPGSSGGGLFNAKGELVGITTFRMKGEQSLNFALPVEWVEQIAREHPSRWAGPPVPIEPKAPAATWSDRAEALDKAQDWQGMMTWCRRWTQAEPGDSSAWFGLGFAYGKLGRHREAIAAYRECLRLEPDIAGTWHNLGHTYAKLGRHREAIQAYRNVLRLKPDDAEAWVRLGHAYGDLRRAREAIGAYQEALRLNPDYTYLWGGIALLYSISGNRSAALEAVKELRRYDPKEADRLFNLIMKP
jgi:cytochrome c-type biogenesis protein CcmH/NrfG